MASKNKHINQILLLFGLLVIGIMGLNYKPVQNWDPTWHQYDDQPYGGAALHHIGSEIFDYQKITSVFVPLNQYQFKDRHSILIASQSFHLDETEADSLVSFISKGNTALILAHDLSFKLGDSLLLRTSQTNYLPNLNLNNGTSTTLDWTIKSYPKKSYNLKRELGNYHIARDKNDYLVLAENNKKLPLLLEYKIGKGTVYIGSIPLALANYHLMDTSASDVGLGLLSLLPEKNEVLHFEFYQMGRMESQSPLRYVLSKPPLRLAIYLSLFTALIFMIFKGKRQQRIIPEIPPVKNKSLDFVHSLGELYFHYQQGHKGLVEKREKYFKEYVWQHFGVNPKMDFNDYLDTLSKKSGFKKDKLKSIFYFFKEKNPSTETLLTLEKLLHQFYNFRK